MEKALLLLFLVTIGCFAAPKPIARKTRLHRSEECAELSDLDSVVEELAILSLGKRSSSGSVSPVTPASPETPTVKRARSTQPDAQQE